MMITQKLWIFFQQSIFDLVRFFLDQSLSIIMHCLLCTFSTVHFAFAQRCTMDIFFWSMRFTGVLSNINMISMQCLWKKHVIMTICAKHKSYIFYLHYSYYFNVLFHGTFLNVHCALFQKCTINSFLKHEIYRLFTQYSQRFDALFAE